MPLGSLWGVLPTFLLLGIFFKAPVMFAQGTPAEWKALYDSAYSIRNYEPDVALQLAQQIRTRATNANNTEWALRGQTLEGLVYLIVGKNDTANLCLVPVYANPDLPQWPDLHSQVLFQTGVLAERRTELSRAVDLLNQSINLSTQLGDSVQVAKACGTLRSVYLDLNQYTKALGLAKRALGAYRSQNDSLGISRTFTDLANLYNLLSDTTTALIQYDSALVYTRAIGYSTGLAAILSNISSIYLQINKFDSVFSYLNQAIAINIATNNNTYLTFNYSLLGSYYRHLNKLDSAKFYMQKAYHLSIHHNPLIDQETMMLSLAPLLYHFGEYQRAFVLLDSAYKMREAIFNTEQLTEIGQLQQQYEYEAQQQAAASVAAAQAEANRQRANFQFLLIFAIVGLAVLGVVLSGRLRIGPRAAGALTLFVILLFFEAFLVFLDPVLDAYTSGLPLPKLGANLVLAVLFTLGHEAMNRRLNRRAKQP